MYFSKFKVTTTHILFCTNYFLESRFNFLSCAYVNDIYNRPLAVKIVFLFADNEEAEEGGGDVRVVVSGPRAGDTAM